jgi:hypothetical protein
LKPKLRVLQLVHWEQPVVQERMGQLAKLG